VYITFAVICTSSPCIYKCKRYEYCMTLCMVSRNQIYLIYRFVGEDLIRNLIIILFIYIKKIYKYELNNFINFRSKFYYWSVDETVAGLLLYSQLGIQRVSIGQCLYSSFVQVPASMISAC